MKVWGRNTSINVQKVLWTLGELGRDYERVDLGGPYGGLDDPSYLALNPNGLIPTLEDGDLVVWESAAIVRYLAARYGEGTLWDADPARRARADMWMEWGATTLQPLMITSFLHAARLKPEKRDEATLEAAADSLSSHLGVLERHLKANGPFVAGERLTIGDIGIGCHLYRYDELPIPRSVLPAIADYYERLKERAAFRDGVMISFESLVATV